MVTSAMLPQRPRRRTANVILSAVGHNFVRILIPAEGCGHPDLTTLIAAASDQLTAQIGFLTDD